MALEVNTSISAVTGFADIVAGTGKAGKTHHRTHNARLQLSTKLFKPHADSDLKVGPFNQEFVSEKK